MIQSNNQTEPEFVCPSCGTTYVCETECGDYRCRVLDPVPVAKKRGSKNQTAREWLDNDANVTDLTNSSGDVVCVMEDLVELLDAYASSKDAEIERLTKEKPALSPSVQEIVSQADELIVMVGNWYINGCMDNAAIAVAMDKAHGHLRAALAAIRNT